MADNVTIEDAFEILQVTLEEAITAVQDNGSDAMRQGNFDEAERVIKRARQLATIKGRLEDLHKSFEEHVITEVEPESNHSRLRHGLKTSQEAYQSPILQVLVELGGSADLNTVLERVYELMEDQLNEYDHQPLPSDKNTTRWRNTAQWARNTLRSNGLLRDDSPRGIWEISDAGRNWLES